MTLGPNRDWDARTYHQVAQPHAAWGANVLDRLELNGDETILDAGCGSGRVTTGLLESLPRGHVIAADLSSTMLAEARQTLAPYGDRVTFLEVDLQHIDNAIEQPVDGIFSTATFHWIADHADLFRVLHAILVPGGQLVAQCGGGAKMHPPWPRSPARSCSAATWPLCPRHSGMRSWTRWSTLSSSARAAIRSTTCG